MCARRSEHPVSGDSDGVEPLSKAAAAAHNGYEIVVSSGKKIIGSAQVRGRDYCLQHGSIPLDGSFRGIERLMKGTSIENLGTTFLSAELKREVSRDEAEAVFHSAFSEAVPLVSDELTADEIAKARELVRSKYSTDSWNFSR